MSTLLLQASRDGDLEVVLRLLYTNPFIGKQELRNALWVAARHSRVEVLRSLIEFKVDPRSVPSLDVSRPPPSLTGFAWTPLLAMAVNNSNTRAQVVAELLHGCISLEDDQKQREARKLPPSMPSMPDASASGSGSSGHGAEHAPHRLPPRGNSDVSAKVMEAPLRAPEPMARSKSSPTSRAKCRDPDRERAAAHAKLKGCSPTQQAGAGSFGADAFFTNPTGSGGSVAPSSEACNPPESGTAEEFEASLAPMSDEDLAALEAKLESRMSSLRRHRQKRLELQLRSVQRRHAEEQKGRTELEEDQCCVISSAAQKCILFLPCRHLCCCKACAIGLTICPLCRASIENPVHCIT